ncbi:hypothetical protein [Nostoc parmelioides]|uniref:hypothetical protein n=1 Tax=Nostoc parmelioides TaxID=1521621 RepID=UPI001F548D0B|nr:hypothetical protein [Nostoc parmelioides]
MARRNDPSYAQLSGYISKEVVKEFKMACTDLEISQVDAMEEAVKLWLEQYKANKAKK